MLFLIRISHLVPLLEFNQRSTSCKRSYYHLIKGQNTSVSVIRNGFGIMGVNLSQQIAAITALQLMRSGIERLNPKRCAGVLPRSLSRTSEILCDSVEQHIFQNALCGPLHPRVGYVIFKSRKVRRYPHHRGRALRIGKERQKSSTCVPRPQNIRRPVRIFFKNHLRHEPCAHI
jgi:hypothetical protein